MTNYSELVKAAIRKAHEDAAAAAQAAKNEIKAFEGQDIPDKKHLRSQLYFQCRDHKAHSKDCYCKKRR